MNTDIFSKNFKPYIIYSKGFWSSNLYNSKRVYIKPHYSYMYKYGVKNIDFKNPRDRKLFFALKKQGRVFYPKDEDKEIKRIRKETYKNSETYKLFNKVYKPH